VNRIPISRGCVGVLIALLFLAYSPLQLGGQVVSADPAKMLPIGTVDERFQSYNIEMVEVVGGRFWKPYRDYAASTNKAQPPPRQAGAAPAGLDPNLFQYRPPIDLSNSRLRKLAAALGPAYVRVSGTWANSVYFHNSDDPPPGNAPPGFSGMLTRKEWKGVIDFAHAVNGEIVTSFATSVGTRDANRVWTAEQARQLLGYTKSAGGRIAAAEFMNEPTFATIGGAPKGYDAEAFGRDIAVFRLFLKQNSRETVFLGPGSVGEGPLSMTARAGTLKTEDLLKATGSVFDVFSYHVYAAVSERCKGGPLGTTPAAALSDDWLLRSEKIAAFYADLRDRFEPRKPLWITETADAACGGNPWASSFLDSFRYLVQHAGLAQRGVKVIMHNTLAASDYGLLEEKTFEPRPNYWAALLWRKLMGTTVLDPQISPASNVYTYAHCLKDHPGGVALLIVNANHQRSYDVTLPAAQRFTLSAKQLQDSTVQLNGTVLQLDTNDNIPQVAGEATRAGRVSFAPGTITFLAIANAGNSNCH
jgi:heparanase